MSAEDKSQQIHPFIKLHMGFAGDAPDDEVRDYMENVFPTEVEKPCGILSWCPYGPLVEDFPLHPEAEAYAIEHGKYVRWDPTPHGQRPDGTPYPGRWVECGPHDEDAQPDLNFATGKIYEPKSCAIFGHDCPVFYVAEPFSDPDAEYENCLCDECRAELNAEAEASAAAKRNE